MLEHYHKSATWVKPHNEIIFKGAENANVLPCRVVEFHTFKKNHFEFLRW